MIIHLDTESPEDRHRFRRMARNYIKGDWPIDEALAGLTSPPKPEEPMGIGAIVRLRDGMEFIRLHGHTGDCNDWYRLDKTGMTADDIGIKGRRKYSTLDVVTVVAEGKVL